VQEALGKRGFVYKSAFTYTFTFLTSQIQKNLGSAKGAGISTACMGVEATSDGQLVKRPADGH